MIYFAIIALIGLALTRGAAVSRRSGRSSSLGALDEVFHPTQYESHLEIVAQDERQVPRPIPGDPPALPYDGRAGAIARAHGHGSRRRPRTRSRLRAWLRSRRR